MSLIIRLLMFPTLLALAACDPDHPPPLPYAVMPRDANLLNAIVHQAGVEITPPEGVPAEIGGPLAKALVDALQEQDIPAITGQKLEGAHAIKGMARMDAGAIVVDWVLYTPDGAELGGVKVRDALSADASADKPLPATVIQALTAQAVAALALHFPATSGEQGENLRVFVPDIPNVPGDGGKSLPTALRNALRAAGMSIAEAQDPQAIRIEGQVILSELDAANQLVKLTWRVLAPDGSEIGLVDQGNPVPHGRLDGNWGDVAYGAAAGAAEGIVPLLQDYQARPAAPAADAAKPAQTP